MNVSQAALVRRARLVRLGDLLKEAMEQGRETVSIAELYPRFEGRAAFGQLANLHCFLSRLPLMLELHGQGGGRSLIYVASTPNFIRRCLTKKTKILAWPEADFEPTGDIIFAPQMQHEDVTWFDSGHSSLHATPTAA